MLKRRSPKVLISYRRADTGAVAGHLAEKLKRPFGAANVFIDVDNIPYGVDFRDHIRSTMADCNVVLALIGPRWVGEDSRRIDDPSDYLRIEIETAFQLGLRVIPVLVDGARMPGAATLPTSLEPLAFLNAAPLSIGRDFDVHSGRIADAIRLVPDEPPRPATQETRPTPTGLGGAVRSMSGVLPTLFVCGGAALEWTYSALVIRLFEIVTTGLLTDVLDGDTVTVVRIVAAAVFVAISSGLAGLFSPWRLRGLPIAVVNVLGTAGIVYAYYGYMSGTAYLLALAYLAIRLPALCLWLEPGSAIRAQFRSWWLRRQLERSGTAAPRRKSLAA